MWFLIMLPLFVFLIIVQCAVIEIDNGVVRQDGKGLSNSQTVLQESSVDYECDQGYTMAGSRVLNCVEALRGFDRRPPVCERKATNHCN